MRTLLKIIGGLLIGILIGLLLSTAGIVLFTDTSLEEFLSAFGKLEPGEGILSIITGIGALIVSLFLLVTTMKGGTSCADCSADIASCRSACSISLSYARKAGSGKTFRSRGDGWPMPPVTTRSAPERYTCRMVQLRRHTCQHSGGIACSPLLRIHTLPPVI